MFIGGFLNLRDSGSGFDPLPTAKTPGPCARKRSDSRLEIKPLSQDPRKTPVATAIAIANAPQQRIVSQVIEQRIDNRPDGPEDAQD